MNGVNQVMKYFSCVLTAAMILSGCNTTETPPELVEPVSMNQTYRPVEKRIIGSPKILVGHYVPQEYCHFFKKATPVKEIVCDIGQYVEEGDVLAYADVEKLQEELRDTKAALALSIAKQAVKQPLHSCTMKSLEIQASTCECLEDAERLQTQIDVEKENYLYDDKLYSFMVEKYQEEIAETEKLIKDGTLRAKKSGYVTFIKNMAVGNQTKANENVVIVSDDTDLHIEVAGLTTKAFLYRDFGLQYALINGEEAAIEEYAYTSKELAYAKAQELYPNVRFKTVEDIKGNPGDFVLLYFLNTTKEPVLAVGKDSTNVDETGNYVYVKGEDGEVTKTYFEAGTADNHYLEVKSGLKEGDMVLFVQEASVPDQYDTYQVTLTDYVQTLPAKRYQEAETAGTAYFTPCDGKVKSIAVAANDYVKKGDTLAVIDSEGGKAKLTEAENDLTHVQLDYIKKCRELDKQTDELKKQTARFIESMEKASPDDGVNEYKYGLVSAQRTLLETEINIRNLQKELARVEYESALQQKTDIYNKIRKNNNGSGEYKIVALNDGIVSKLYVKEGTSVTQDGENSLLLSCTKQTQDKAAVSMPQNKDLFGSVASAAVDTGRRLTFINGGQKLDSVCLGSMYNTKNYVFSDDEKTYVTTCSTEGQKEGFIASVSEPSFWKDGSLLSGCDVEVEVMRAPKMIVIPKELVHTEEVKLSNDVQYYVWKLTDGELGKQYVIIGNDYGVGIGDSDEIVILTGLKEGDVIAGKLSEAHK